MKFRYIIEYATDEPAEMIGGVHDSIERVLYNILPYMVYNVAIDFEVIDEDEE